MRLLLIKNLWLDEEFFLISKLLDLNFWIVFLVFILYLIMLIVDFFYKFRLNLLLISLVTLLYSSNLLTFFFFYEMIFILIIFVILLLGYRYERLIASYLIIFYSFIFSRPVIILLLIIDKIFLIKNWLFFSYILVMFIIGSFMVKFPIFGFHYWLPVAHVEASTIGSMLLAGILLKIGCLGLFYVVYYIKFMVKFHWLSVRVILIILIILILSDLKIIIAYSSVAHIRMVFYVIMIGNVVGKQGALIIIFYHGYVSPIIFWLVGSLAWWKTRSLMVVKFLSFSFLFILIIFLLCILNIGFPPFIGFLREILILKSLIQFKFIVYVFIVSILFSAYYNLYFFWSFNRVIGYIFKINLFNLDVFIFILLSLFLNF